MNRGSGIRIGLIGGGFIGRSHALAIRAVNATFAELPLRACAHVLCDLDAGKAARLAGETGFANWTDDWRQAVEDADAVVIAVPGQFHHRIASHAIERGKAVLCEKPVGLSAAENQALADAAQVAGVVNAVGFTYLRAPMVAHARQLLDSGILGRPVHFHGRHFEDYLASPDAPFSWRMDPAIAGRCGALGDLGCHILAVARYLCGPVASLSGNSAIVHPLRPADPGRKEMRAVGNEDYASAQLRFESGTTGMIEASRVALGCKMDIAFELICDRGAIRFGGERMNELSVYLQEDADRGIPGFRRVLINAGHPGYPAFLPAPGHGLGFNDLKTIEIAAFLRGIATGDSVYPDLAEAARIARICEAILDSSEARGWIDNPEHSPST
ncbi:Gfo/Idh/MocA family protein [Paracoccus sp. (in: a-proteobacteria)]|uniref:Gfo/Idh/MocA family protein n=1 Tax=Paracoccus sp. TaxID=267 RepID=UPI003A8BCB5E